MLQIACSIFVMCAIIGTSYAREGPPKIWLQPQQSMYYSSVYNYSIMLSCGADGSVPIRFSWERNGVPVKFKEFGSGNGRFELNHDITSPDQADEGDYICYVSNDFGHAMTHPVRLTHAVLDDHYKQNAVYNETSERGRPISLPCDVPHSLPEPEVYWVKVPTIAATPNRIQYGERITSDIYGNIHFIYIDNGDAGGYRCAIHNALLQKTTYGPIFNMRVTGVNQNTEPQLIWNSDEFPVALHGSDVMFTCMFGGKPIPQVVWYDEQGNQMKSDQVIDYGRTLILRNVRFSDARWYQCSVPGTAFTGGVNFRLSVEKGPAWIRKPNPIKANIGEQVSFNCSASGVPEPTIIWYIDTTPARDVETSKKPSRIENTQLTGSTISILHFTASQSFTIICEASNQHGYLWDGTYLYVDGLAPTTRSPTTPSPTQGPTTPKPEARSSNAAVIGGAVGGVIVVVIIVVVVVYCVWSKRRNSGQKQPNTNVTMAYRNRPLDNAQQPTASGGKGEPYSGLSNARDKAPQGNVYDELDPATNAASASNRNEETEYCYISDSDIIAAQRQSGKPIPSVRNNKPPGASGASSDSPSVGYNVSDGKKLSHFPSGKYSSMNDPVYKGQAGDQDFPSSPEYLEPTQTHDYFVLEKEEKTSL